MSRSESSLPWVLFVPYKTGPDIKEREGLKAPRRDVVARLPNGTDASYSYYDFALEGYLEAPHV